MTVPAARFADIEADCAAHGLLVLGAFHPEESDGVPVIAGMPAQTLLLVGNAGPAMWEAFSARIDQGEHRNPLDRWSDRILGTVAKAWGGLALFPFGGPPYHPFQRWALKAGSVSPSPLGVLVHPRYGPWFAYRGALAFKHRFDLPPAGNEKPCTDCRDKPCLAACPVGAIDPAHGYDVARCRAHVSQRNNACFNTGCLARHACPLGRDFAYTPEQAQFHMRAFVR